MTAFPFGVFREVLRGLNKIHVANAFEMVGIIGQGVGICLAVSFSANLSTLVLIGILANIAPLIAMAGVIALKANYLFPRLHLFRLGRVRELAGFSLVAYFITMTNLVMGQTDQLLIGGMLGVAAIALYQPGFKLAQMFGQMALQMQDVLGPIAAKVAGKDASSDARRQLIQLFIGGQRWGTIIALLLGIPALVLAAPLLRLLTGEEAPNTVMIMVAQALVLGSILSIIGSGTGKRILMMSGHHRKVLWLSLAEAALNLSVSLGALWWFQSPLGAALGTLVAHILVPIPLVLPLCARSLGCTQQAIWAATFQGMAAFLPAMLVAIISSHWLLPVATWWIEFIVVIGIGVTSLIGVVIIGMRRDERQVILKFISRLLPNISHKSINDLA